MKEMLVTGSVHTPPACAIFEMPESNNARACLLHSDIQRALVPPITHKATRLEAYGQSIPKDDVGGDLVDLVAGIGDVTAYVADVSGHGLRAGILMGMIKTAMRYGLLLQLPLSKVLADINSVLLPMKEPSMFATLAALRFDDSKQLEYLSAGHCPLLHYRRRSGDVVRHSMSQFPLGLFVSTRYASLRIPYEGGDIFVLVTDGLLETGEDQDADCGLERLSETVRRLSDQPVAEIVEAIYGHARQDGPQQDDQTILLVGINEDLESQNRDAQPDQCPKLQDASRALEAKWQNLLGDLATELARD